jgi:hypothetical protein
MTQLLWVSKLKVNIYPCTQVSLTAIFVLFLRGVPDFFSSTRVPKSCSVQKLEEVEVLKLKVIQTHCTRPYNDWGFSPCFVSPSHFGIIHAIIDD